MLITPLLCLALCTTPIEPPAPTATAPTVQDQAAPATDHDRWYSVEMMGGKAGWMHSRQTTREGVITTRTKMQFTMGRGDAGVEITMASEFVETEDGKPVSMRSQNKLGASPVDKQWTFKGDKVEVVTRQGGRSSTQTVDAPKGEWLTPAAAEREMLAKFRAGEKTITARTISPETDLQVVGQTRSGFSDDTITVDGKPVQAIKTNVVTDAMGGVTSAEWIDAEGELLRSETNLGGIAVVMTRTTKALAQEEGEGFSPEIMVKTFVKPDRKINDPRSTTRAVYVLSTEGDDLPDIPSSGAQRVDRLDAHSARVTVDVAQPQPADAGDANHAPYLASSTTADLTDQRLLDLAKKSLRTAPEDKAKRAEVLRRAVFDHISDKNLATALATASEVVRTRAGDCSEHGVLLAALLRADGIPSRVATGVIYADSFAGSRDIFGYHMWAQALLDGPHGPQWVDLDATFPPEIVFDATHIAIAHYDLGDVTLNESLVNLARVLGLLKIKVESVEHREEHDAPNHKDGE
jgi:hypothetical protein